MNKDSYSIYEITHVPSGREIRVCVLLRYLTAIKHAESLRLQKTV
jgi:hypothetical protein